jgi:outer membrane lipoprotein LolB
VRKNSGQIRFPAVILLLLTLQGCSLLTRHSEESRLAWEARRERLAQIDRFTLQARVSSGGIFGIKGNLHWRQGADDFEMRVAGPFGVGAATITGRGKMVEIKTSKRTFTTDNPEQDLHDRLGWTFPVSHLRWWALGVPAPGAKPRKLELDEEGLVLGFEQDDWTLEFTEYQPAGGHQLPRKFEAANDEVRIKVVIDAWSGLPTTTLGARSRK